MQSKTFFICLVACSVLFFFSGYLICSRRSNGTSYAETAKRLESELATAKASLQSAQDRAATAKQDIDSLNATVKQLTDQSEQLRTENQRALELVKQITNSGNELTASNTSLTELATKLSDGIDSDISIVQHLQKAK